MYALFLRSIFFIFIVVILIVLFACRDARLVRPLQWYVHSSICSVVGGRTSRASLHFAPLFRSFFARKGTRIFEQRELREALCLLVLRALRARVREDV